jgi:hypothetical protein
VCFTAEGAAVPLVAMGVRSNRVPLAIASKVWMGCVAGSTFASAKMELLGSAVGGGLGGSGTSKRSRIPGTCDGAPHM